MITELGLYLRMYGVIDSIHKLVRSLNKPKEPWYRIENQWRLFSLIKGLIAEKRGLEIGGPTRLFKRWNWLPIYRAVGNLDNCNFSNSTRWEGNIQGGLTYNFDRKHCPGRQYILEITDLNAISSETYDFVLSSHVLEHTSNPLKALIETKRVLKNDGALILVLPHKDAFFDHKRPVTTMNHLLEDFSNGVSEADLTHLPEILAYHDLDRDPLAADCKTFRNRSALNAENRCLHQHVFDTLLTTKIVDWLGMEILFVEPVLPGDIIVGARKVTHPVENTAFIDSNAKHFKLSPFITDNKQGNHGD